MRAFLPLFLAAAVALGCGGGGEEAPRAPAVTFDTARAWVHIDGDSVFLLVELARTEQQMSFGLMQRDSLDENSGMVFLYDQVQGGDQFFWMYRTRIPLDIAFLDRDGVIDTILHMTPCEAELYPQQACERYAPGTEYWTALEVNRGWFDEHGVAEGGRVVIDVSGDTGEPAEGDTTREESSSSPDFRELRLSVGDAPGDAVGADLDGDGHTDLVVASGDGLTVFLGDGAGGFRRHTTTDAGRNAVGPVTGDFDGDGRTDVLAGDLNGDGFDDLVGPGSTLAILGWLRYRTGYPADPDPRRAGGTRKTSRDRVVTWRSTLTRSSS